MMTRSGLSDEFISHTTKREFAVQKLRLAIETGFYGPGQILRQWQICEDLDLGVTPVREAIIQLCASGLIERSSHHSVKVKDIDIKRLRDIYHVRRLLEEEAITLSVKNNGKALVAPLKTINRQMKALLKSDQLEKIHLLDHQFHDTVFAGSHNAALIAAIDHIKSSFSVYALWKSPGRLAVSVDEHARFIDSLEKGDLAGCVEAHRNHLESGLTAATTVARTTA